MNNLRGLLESEIPHLRRYARALVGDRDEADDLVQSCLERALANAHQWDPSRPLRPWLFRIQHNVCISTLRRRSRERRTCRDLPERRSVAHANDGDIPVAEIEKALDQLSADQRSVLLLVALEGLSYEEAAEALSVPVGTVRSRLSRARRTLRASLEADTGRRRLNADTVDMASTRPRSA